MKTRTNQPITTFDLEDLEVSGKAKLFENIVDKDGNARFIEGEITFETATGLTKTYAKWSLSGSHLLIVVCGDIANGSALTNGQVICKINLPQWVKDKIAILFASYMVDFKVITFWADNWSSQTVQGSLQKSADGTVKVAINGNLTLTSDRHFRIQFDLLIDNE